MAKKRKKGGGARSRRKRRVMTRGGRRVWGRSSRAGTKARPRRPRLLGSPGHFRGSPHSPWRHYRVNPHLLREVGMMYGGNPRHNPTFNVMGDLQDVIRNPMDAVMDGGLGLLTAYMTIAIPNWLLPYPGADITSRLIRAASRVAAGGLLYSLLVPMARGSAGAIKAGAAMGSIGATLFDFLGTRVIIGANDTGQTPMALLAPLSGGVAAPPVTTTGAYARLSAYSQPMLAAARGGRTTTIAAPAAFPARGLVRHNLF